MQRNVGRLVAMLAVLLLCVVGFQTMVVAEEQYVAGQTEFVGVAGKNLPLHVARDAESTVRRKIPDGTILDVIEKDRKWTKVLYDGVIGYTESKFTELVQRRDPFQGSMPGVSTHVALAKVTADTKFTPPGFTVPIKLTAGTYMSVAEVKDGNIYFPYMRLDKYASLPQDQVTMQDFVPWKDAKPGDLIYAFSTFYSTSSSKPLNKGRMANIAVACERLTGKVIAPNAVFSFNEVCAPYTKDNGYFRAPILSASGPSGFGGGTCQVNSTLYNIVLRVPTVVEEMHWHSQQGAKYLPAGFDATVGSASDMRFRNILPYAVRIGYTYGDGVMTAMLYRADE